AEISIDPNTKLWNEQLQTTSTHLSPDSTIKNACKELYAFDNLQPIDKGKETASTSDKYSPIPVLNNLIARASKVSIQEQAISTIALPTETVSIAVSDDFHRFAAV
ncbi:16985_t:CDS:2, partial [Gigaspora margarita]